MNPFLKRKQKAGDGASGVRSEKKTARRLGGLQVRSSGLLAGSRGDINLGDFMVEAKSTKAATLRLDLEWLVKVFRESAHEGKRPALSVSFTRENGDPVRGGTWVMVPESVFRQLVGETPQ